MTEHQSLFTNLIVVVGSATIVATAFHLVRLPPMLGFLVAGIVIGPGGLGWVSSIGEVELLAEIGSVLLLFSLGLEFAWSTVLSLRKLLVNLGLTQVVLTTAVVGTIAHQVWKIPWNQAIFIGSLVAMSCTAAVLKLLHDNRHMETPFGKASLGILISQDMAAILILIALPLLSDSSLNGWQSFTWLDGGRLVARLSLVAAFLVLGTRYFVPQYLALVSRTRSRDVFFFSIVFVCASIALLMQKLGLSLALGAFCAGVMVSESPYGRQTMSDFVPIRDNFLGIFFVAIGMMLNLKFVSGEWDAILGYLALVVLIKTLIIFLLMWWLGNPSSIGVATGLILAQVGEFSFILVERGLHLRLIDERGRQLFLAVAIGSLAVAPLLYRLALKSAFRFDYEQMMPKQIQRLAQNLRDHLIRNPFQVRVHETRLNLSALKEIRDHVVIIGFGPAAQNLAATLRNLDITYRVIEMNQDTVRQYAMSEPIVYGDATQSAILRAVHADLAKLVVVAVSGAEITGAIHRAVRRVNPKAHIVVRTQYLRDLSAIEDSPLTHFVVAEYEGTLALLSQSLELCGIERKAVDDFVHAARERIELEHRQSRSAAPPS